MFNFAINNEAIQGLAPIPLLTTNPYIGDMSIMAEPILTKTCTKCQIEKSLANFYRKSSSADGYESWCKDCKIVWQKQYYQEHKENRILFQKEYWVKNANRRADYNSKYRDKNRERMLEYCRKYNQDHKEENVQYRKANKEKIAARDKLYRSTESGRNVHNRKSHNRRAKIAGVMVDAVNPIEIFERDGFKCQLCGIKTRLDYNRYHPKRSELDHIIPLSLGGEHSKRNTQCLCRHCNATKRNAGIGDQLRLFG